MKLINAHKFEKSRWPSSDLRMDTTHAYHNVTQDQNRFNNIRKMPILVEFVVYKSQLYRDKNTLLPAQIKFIRSYYPGCFAKQNPSISTYYWSYLALLKKSNQTQLIGSYVTGSNCRDCVSCEEFPKSIIDCYKITNTGHYGLSPTEEFSRDGRWVVDPRDNKNIKRYQVLLVTEAIARNADFLYLDNMLHISYTNGQDLEAEFIKGYIKHIDQLSRSINKAGYGVLYNLGKYPRRDFLDSDQYQSSFFSAIGNNGIYLEHPFRYRADAELTKWEMKQISRHLEFGALVVLSPYPEGYSDHTRLMWMAAMAMVIRQPGDSLFLCTENKYDDTYKPWINWPHQYGKPTNKNFEFQKSDDAANPDDFNWWYAKRTFSGRKEVIVVHIHVRRKPGEENNARLPPTISLEGFELIYEPKPDRGEWLNDVYVVDNHQIDNPDSKPDIGSCYSDRFILGANFDKMEGIYKKIIAVDVCIEKIQ